MRIVKISKEEAAAVAAAGAKRDENKTGSEAEER